MPRETCIRCDSELIPNPDHAHWSHCPNCEPTFVAAIRELNAFTYLKGLVHRAVTDQRGRPSIGGVQK